MKRRNWKEAREKVDLEGKCRSCGLVGSRLEAAHLWPRSRGGLQEPDGIVPLCPDCHRLFDSHRLDLLSVLNLIEQVELVRQAGGIETARIRVLPSEYRRLRERRN